jgi:hypothetical protein
VKLGIADDGECAGHEQAAQIAVPLFAILPSLFRPPLEYCLGTSPIQAEKLRPDRKALGSGTLATSAVAVHSIMSGLLRCSKGLPIRSPRRCEPGMILGL